MRKLAVGLGDGQAPVKACGLCNTMDHPTEVCPTMGQDVEVMAAGFAPRRNYEPYGGKYNQGLRGHPNLKWSNPKPAPPVTGGMWG